MAFSRITGLTVNLTPFYLGIGGLRVKKKDPTDSGNSHASSTVRVKPTNGTAAGTYFDGVWVYDPTTAGGGFTHYADCLAPEYYLIDFVIEARDTSSDSWEVFPSIAIQTDTPDTVLYAASGSVPSKPTLTFGTPGVNNIPVTWAAVAGAVSYKLFRSLSSGSGFERIGGTITTNNFNSTGLTAATKYYYYLVATNGTGDSDPSDTVSATTTSVGGGTATGVPSFTNLTGDGKLKRHQYRYTFTSDARAVIEMEYGTGGTVVVLGAADANGDCIAYPSAKVPLDISTIRVRAIAPGKTPSDWSSAIDVIDGLSTDKWFRVYETVEGSGLFEAFIVTFTGDPDSEPDSAKGQKLSDAPRSSAVLARKDGINHFESL